MTVSTFIQPHDLSCGFYIKYTVEIAYIPIRESKYFVLQDLQFITVYIKKRPKSFAVLIISNIFAPIFLKTLNF